MQKYSFNIILWAMIIFLLNIFVFFSMGDYVSRHGDFINQFMYYLTVILILGSFILSYVGYRDLSALTMKKKLIANIIFYSHLLGLAIFIGTVWFVNT